MLGDLILWIKKIIKQQTCVHEYKYINASYKTNSSCSDFEQCIKCGKIK